MTFFGEAVLNLDRFKNWAIGFALLMLVLATSALSRGVSPVTFGELANFREIATRSQFPTTDPFAYTDTHSRLLHPHWGFGAVVHGFMVLSNWETQGLLILKYLICFGVAIACHGYSVRNGVSLPTFAVLSLFALALAAPLGMNQVQPAMFSAVALVGLLGLLSADRSRKGIWAWGAVPLMALWANLHEGALIGLLILATYGLTRIAQQYRESQPGSNSAERDFYLWLVLLISAVAVLLNPNSSRLVTYFLAQIVSHPDWGFELQPIWQTQSLAVQLMFLATIAIAGYGIVSAKPWPVFESVVLLLTCTFAINLPTYAPMYIICWILLTPPLIERTRVALQMQTLAVRHRVEFSFVSLAVGLVALGSAIQCRYWDLPVLDKPQQAVAKTETVYPVSAVSFLAEHAFAGNLLVPDHLGGYISWRLYPQVKISADDRGQQVYHSQSLKRNRSFFRATEDWASLIEPTTDAILVPTDASVLRLLEQEVQSGKIDWKLVYQDSGFCVFVRKGTQVAQRLDPMNSTN